MIASATIGTTTYGFRYLLLDEQRAPSLISIVEQTRQTGLAALQVCENARPLKLSSSEWSDVVRAAGDCGIELHAGCMTLDPETFARYMDLAARIPGSNALRIVLENEDGAAASRDSIVAFLDRIVPRLETSGIKLAIENHFHIPCRMLAEVVERYPCNLVGFCIDSANSLRNFEPAEQVFELLGSRGMFYHLKDFRVEGTNVGFTVKGAPLGEGELPLRRILTLMTSRFAQPLIFLENWTPQTGDRERDIETDAAWLARSLENLRAAMSNGRIGGRDN
jgi:sugar phosphate isomerase/epimerase